MQLKDYYNLLAKHDWFYMYSDDGRVYKAGCDAEAKLKRLAQTSPAHAELLKGFEDHHFSGDPWGTPKKPLPERPV